VTAAIVDTSAVLALLDQDHPAHPQLAALVRDEPWELVLTPLVVAEADYMLVTRLGDAAARAFGADVAAGAYTLGPWSASDHAAATQVSAQHHDYVGVTDAANVVLAARYQTTRMLTFDQRHFRMLRPMVGGDAFTLLPDDWTD
jgi:uncharacterized protein